MGGGDLLARVPPQNLEAEQSVLGAVFLDNHALDQVTTILEADDFYRDAHREIFGAMIELANAKTPIDTVTLAERLRTSNVLEAIGGGAYLAELADFVPTATNAVHYARIVREKAVLRRMAAAAAEIASRAYDGVVDVGEFLGESEAKIGGVCRMPLGRMALTPIDLAMLLAVDRELSDTTLRISTGFRELDAMLQGGLRRSSMTTLAAGTSQGKSALALNIATGVSRGGVLYVSNEMPREDLLLRAAASMSYVDWTTVRGRGELADSEKERLMHARSQLAAMNLEVVFQRSCRPSQVRGLALQHAANWDGRLDLVVVDYLQLMRADGEHENRNLEIASMTAALKDLAQELDCALLVLSQITRQGKNRFSPEPQLSDLRDSGAIEQDSDAVMFLWEAPVRKGEVEPEPNERRPVKLSIKKQRNGPKGTIELYFDPPLTRFSGRLL